jgi:hypothetical protein
MESKRWARESKAGVLADKTLGSGAEEGEVGDELESVGATAHQVFERNAAGESIADGARDFLVAGANPPSLKLRRGEGPPFGGGRGRGNGRWPAEP